MRKNSKDTPDSGDISQRAIRRIQALHPKENEGEEDDPRKKDANYYIRKALAHALMAPDNQVLMRANNFIDWAWQNKELFVFPDVSKKAKG